MGGEKKTNKKKNNNFILQYFTFVYNSKYWPVLKQEHWMRTFYTRSVTTRQPITTIWVKQLWIFCQEAQGLQRTSRVLQAKSHRHFRKYKPKHLGYLKYSKAKEKDKILNRSGGNGTFQAKDCFKSQLMNIFVCHLYIVAKRSFLNKTWGNCYTYNSSLTIRHKKNPTKMHL